MALAWCYTKWQVASTIIGVTTLAQLDEDLDAWGTTLSPELLAEIDKIRWEIRDPAAWGVPRRANTHGSARTTSARPRPPPC
jgi:diketogulonate reductase-like aldo/keto reductase